MKYLPLFCCLLLAACNPSSSQDNLLDDWAPDRIHEIESLDLNSSFNDLAELQNIVNDADIVCLGESRHDIHEQFQLKNRLVRYLVEEMGFTTFALEGSLPYSKRLNGYIKNGTGSIDSIMANMPGWFLWDTEEFKELFNWPQII